MNKIGGQVTSRALSVKITQGMLEMKAVDIQIFDLRSVKHAIADFFVMCSGNSDIHIDSISQMIEKYAFDQAKQKPWHKEGYSNKEWILIDFVIKFCFNRFPLFHFFGSHCRLFWFRRRWGNVIKHWGLIDPLAHSTVASSW